MPTATNTYLLSEIQSDVRKVLDQNAAETGILSSNRDTLELNALIEQKVEHAAQQILEAAPLRYFQTNGTETVTGEYAYLGHVKSDAAKYLQRIERPSDFLRALSFNVHGTPAPTANVNDDPSDEPDESDSSDSAAPAEEIVSYETFIAEDAAAAGVTSSTSTADTSWKKTLVTYEMVDSELYDAAKSKFDGIRPNPHRPAVFYNPYFDWFEFFGCDNWGKATMWYVKIPELTGENASTALCFPDVLYKALLYQTASLVETAYKNLPAAQMYSSVARSYMGLGENETQTQTTKK